MSTRFTTTSTETAKKMGRNYVYGGSIWEGVRSDDRLIGNAFIENLKNINTS